MKKIFFLCILLFTGIPGVFADIPTIHSTNAGGSWDSASTWIEGRVPNIDDIVEINGSVGISTFTLNGDLIIDGSGSLYNPNINSTFTLNGDLLNNGYIDLHSTKKVFISNFAGFRTYDYYTNLKVNGNIENNGNITDSRVYITDSLSNNGEFSGSLTTTGTGNVTISGDISGSIVKLSDGNLSLGGYVANLGLGKDTELIGNLDVGNLNLDGNELNLNGTTINEIGELLGKGKLYSSLNNVNELNINKISTGNNTELLFDKINTNFINGSFVSNDKIYVSDGGLQGGTVTTNSLILSGLISSSTFTLNGDLIIDGSGSLYNPNINSTFTLNGDLLNNGYIDLHSTKKVFISNFAGFRTYDYYTNLKVNGNIENNGSITDSRVYLLWDKIEDYSNYILNITNQEEISINNATQYLISNDILNNSLDIYWKVKGDGTLSDSEYIVEKCINVSGCIINGGDFSYANVEENNSSIITSGNYNSGEFILSDYLSNVNTTENNFIGPIQIIKPKDAGDPVNLHSGEFVYDNTLMQQSGVGMPFEFKIHYKNKAYYNGPIGNNFDFNYNQFLLEDSEGNVNYHNGKLGVVKFVKNDTGFDYNTIFDSQLTQVDNKYIITVNNTIKWTFGENLRLESQSDNYGNKLLFTYNENKQLTTVTDTLNRNYTFSYYDHSRLQTITDFSGDTVTFNYFSTGSIEGSEYDLANITTTHGTDSRNISFTYTIGDTFEDSHNIIKLIDSEDNIYVENTYDENDRVSSQKYGEASIYYNYTLTGSGKISKNRVIDRSGNQTIYIYDDKGNTIKKVVNKVSGDSIYEYEYNENSKLITEKYPLGNGYTYKYDNKDNLIERRFKSDIDAPEDSSDIVYSYTYDDTFNMKTSITQPNGTITNFTLDSNGEIIKTEVLGVQDFEGNSLVIMNTFEYNALGQLITTTDANGNITEFEYENGNLVKSIKNPLAPLSGGIARLFSYDENNNITSITDGEGNITNLSYDEFNLLQSQITPEGIVSQYEYNSLNKKVNESIILSDNSEVTTNYQYDILDNPTVITKDRESNKTDIIVTKYDNDSRIIETKSSNNAVNTFEYNESGQIIKKITKSTIGDIVTEYSYDVNNRLLTQINPNNSITTFEYDLFDRVIKQTDSEGTYSEFTYDKSGNITTQEVSDTNNILLQKQTNTFDTLGRNIITNIHNLDKNEIIISKSKYDAVGNMIQSIDPKGNITNYEYDSFNRVIKVTDSLGNITENSYNKNDKVIRKALIPAFSQREEGEAPIVTTYVYDRDNRVVSETNTLGETMSYSYNNLNQVISKTDKDNGVTNYAYDFAGNILSESHVGKTISYTYDNNSNLETVTDANNNITTYGYNDITLLESITYPDGNIMRYEYDISGNMITKTDPNGTVIESNYDNLNRLVSKTITRGSGVLGVTSENYTYDALSRLTSATDSEGHDLEFDFDSLGRLTSETNGNKTIGYDYDLVGNRTQIMNPNNTEINYSYDNNNRLTQISSPHPSPLPEGEETGIIASYSYDSLSLLSKTLGNNLTTNYGYDELLRLKSLNNYSYTYNIQGNITSNGIDNYTYDSLDRITKSQYGIKHNLINSETFEYDFMGNRTMETLTRMNKKGKEKQKKISYDTNNLNQYTDRTKTSPEASAQGEEESIDMEGRLMYDNNGNLIGNMLNNKRQYIYSYDYKNRLVTIEKNIYKKKKKVRIEKIVEIKYDILGRRIQKLFNNGSYRNYYYSNQDIILEENYSKKAKLKNSKEFTYSNSLDDILSMKLIENKTRKVTEEYINKKGKTKTTRGIAKQERAPWGGKIKEQYVETNTYFYQKDHLGSIIAITDETGNIVEEYAYDVFGKPYTKKANGTITGLKKSKIGNTRMYTGREYDRGLKLYYNRARYYNPKLGRFISRDPIDIVDDVNLYAYVGNNSVMFVDRTGFAAKLSIPQSAVEHYKRNLLNTNLPETEADAINEKWILLDESESVFHSFGNPEGKINPKYISQDGHKEVVFDYKTGQKVEDSRNMGTYNYYSPSDVINHTLYDVIPYYDYGNNYGDFTTRTQRISRSTETSYLLYKGTRELEHNVQRFNQTNFILSLINEFSY